MCQARSDGGRRCPIHRHDSVAVITSAVKETGLAKGQVEHLFRELSREGRDSANPTADQWATFKKSVRENLPDKGGNIVLKNLDKADEHSDNPDGKTFYALTKIQERAANRNSNLTSLIERVAQEKGMTKDNVKSFFHKAYDASKREYGEGRPEGYTQAAYLWAKNNNLPYDTQSVMAIKAIREMDARSIAVPRVTRFPTNNDTITEIGYNPEGGRLEVKLASTEWAIAYRGVPSDVYDSLIDHNNSPEEFVSKYFDTVATVGDYLYENEAEADLDSKAIRCATCGQFASPVAHLCPNTGSAPSTVPAVSTSSETETSEKASSAIKESIEDNDPENDITSDDEAYDSYDPSEPTQMWSGDEPESTYTHVYTNEEIMYLGGFDPLEEDAESDFSISVDFITPNDQQSIEIGLDHSALRDLDSNEDAATRSTISRYLSDNTRGNNQSVRVVTAERSSYETSNGITRMKFECHVLEVAPVQNYGELNHAHGFSANYHPVTDGVAKVQLRKPDVNAYEVDYTGKYDGDSYVKEALIRSSGGHPILENRTAYLENITFDATQSANPAVRIPRLADLRRAVNRSNRFYMPVEVIGRRASSFAHHDDQGYLVNYGRMSVKGYIEYEKGDDGTWNAVRNLRSLRCECPDYNKNYNCQHVDAVARKGNNFLYQSGAFNQPQRQSSEPAINLSKIDNGQYLTSTLARRTDLTVTAPNEKTGQPLRYQFTGLVTEERERNRQLSWYDRKDMHTYYGNSGPINSLQDYKDNHDALMNYYTIRAFSTVNKPMDIAQALRRGGIAEVPVEARIADSRLIPSRVYGNVSLAYDDDRQVTVAEHTLKCDCAEYQEKYDCPHIRATLANSVHIPSIGSRTYYPEGDTHHRLARRRIRSTYSAEIGKYRRLYDFAMANPEATETELQQMLADENAAREERRRIAEKERIRNIQQRELDRLEETHQREAERREALKQWEEEDRERHLRFISQRRKYYNEMAKNSREAAESFKEANPEYAESMKSHRENLIKKWDEPESSYVEDKAKLDAAIKGALERKKNGEDAVPFREEGGVLDGASNGPAGRKFGVELEFQIDPSVSRHQALYQIAKDLHTAGLTNSSEQVEYHSAAANGYRSWSFEEDCTVDGELVSPILDDSPESWRQLRLATEIIRKHGGRATVSSGSHVHVSTGTYETHTAKTAELLRLSRDHEDLTYRMASNPQRNRHRGTEWCRPNVKDYGGDFNTDDHIVNDEIGSHGHGEAVNLDAMNTKLNRSNVEFRVWDGTLDPGVIQAQVMMSVAMVDKAEYNVLKNGFSKVRDDKESNKFGYNRKNGVSHEETHNEGGIAEYLDTFFRKDEDKNQIASLFAVTKWQ